MENARLAQLETKLVSLERDVRELRQEFIAAKKNVSTSLSPTKKENAPLVAKSVQKTAASTSSWEWLVGGNIIGKVGIVTLVLSAAFFMVYALDKGWVSEWVRLLLLQSAFAVLGYLSLRFFAKGYAYIPEVLAVLSLASITIAIYSAHFIYHFIGRVETVSMVLSVMALAFIGAKYLRSTALLLLLFVGFFALPIIHSRGFYEPYFYFGYLLAVNLFFLVLKITLQAKEDRESLSAVWVMLVGNATSVFGFMATYKRYEIAILIFCVVALLILLFSVFRKPWEFQSAWFFKPATILSANLLTVFMIVSVFVPLFPYSKEVLALYVLALAAINYGGLRATGMSRDSTPASALSMALLVALSVVILLEGSAQTLALSVIFAVALYVGARSNDRLLYWGSFIATCLNAAILLAMLESSESHLFLLNFQAATFAVYTAQSVYFVTRKIYPNDSKFATTWLVGGVLASLIGVIAELERIVSSTEARLFMVTLVLAFYALGFLMLGFRKNNLRLRQTGLVFLGVAVFKFYAVDIWQWNTAIRIIAGVILGGSLVVISFFYEKFRKNFQQLAWLFFIVGLISPSQEISASEVVHLNRYPYVRELRLADTNAGKTRLGRVSLETEIYKRIGENNLRIVFEGSPIAYLRKLNVAAQQDAVERSIPQSQIKRTTDGENTTTYIFENLDQVKVKALRLFFKEHDFARTATVYRSADSFSARFELLQTIVQRRNDVPQSILLQFSPTTRSIELEIVNNDNQPLQLEDAKIVVEREELIFRIPESFRGSQKPIILYYGAAYAAKPKYDLSVSAQAQREALEFSMGEEKANGAFRLTVFDPPYSTWIFRTVFWLLIALTLWRLYTLYKERRHTEGE